MREYQINQVPPVPIKYLEFTGHIKLTQEANAIIIHHDFLDDFISILRQIWELKELKKNG